MVSLLERQLEALVRDGAAFIQAAAGVRSRKAALETFDALMERYDALLAQFERMLFNSSFARALVGGHPPMERAEHTGECIFRRQVMVLADQLQFIEQEMAARLHPLLLGLGEAMASLGETRRAGRALASAANLAPFCPPGKRGRKSRAR